jgi:hypothetical protein
MAESRLESKLGVMLVEVRHTPSERLCSHDIRLTRPVAATRSGENFVRQLDRRGTERVCYQDSHAAAMLATRLEGVSCTEEPF